MNETRTLSDDPQSGQEPGESDVAFIVPGMGSDHCAGIVSTSLKRLPGITRVDTSIASHHVDVVFDPARVGAERIRTAVEGAGYEVAAVEEKAKPSARPPAAEEIEERYLARAWQRMWIAAVPTILIMVLMMVHMFRAGADKPVVVEFSYELRTQ